MRSVSWDDITGKIRKSVRVLRSGESRELSRSSSLYRVRGVFYTDVAKHPGVARVLKLGNNILRYE